MGYVQGVPQNPVLITIDGNAFYVWRSSIVEKKGIPHIQMRLEPFDWVISRLGLKKEDLDMSESSIGHVVRSYPLSSRLILSDNPEKPIWLLLTGFNGEKVNWDKPAIAPLIEMKMTIDRLRRRISLLEAERDELLKDNKRLIKKTKEYKEQIDKIYGSGSRVSVLPEELMGMTITKEGVKR